MKDAPRSLSYSLARNLIDDPPGLFRHPLVLTAAANGCFVIAHFLSSQRYLVIVGGLLLIQALFEWRLTGIRELFQEQEQELTEFRQQQPEDPLRSASTGNIRHETSITA